MSLSPQCHHKPLLATPNHLRPLQLSGLCYTFLACNPDTYTDSADADYLYLYYQKRALVVRSADVFHTCTVDWLEQ